jgi:hypothetical protein
LGAGVSERRRIVKYSILGEANNDFVDDRVGSQLLAGLELLVKEFRSFVQRRDVMWLSFPGANH